MVVPDLPQPTMKRGGFRPLNSHGWTSRPSCLLIETSSASPVLPGTRTGSAFTNTCRAWPGRTGSSSSTGRWRSRVRSPEGRGEAEGRAIARGSVRRVGERLYVADPPAALPLRFERPVTVVNQAVRGSFIARVARAPRLRKAAPLDPRHRRGPNREAGRPMGLALLGHRRSSDWARLQG